jgi:hypothetical protein
MKTLSLTSPLINNYPSVYNQKNNIRSTADNNISEKKELAVTGTVNLLDKLLKRFIPFFFVSAAIYLFYISVHFIYFFLL